MLAGCETYYKQPDAQTAKVRFVSRPMATPSGHQVLVSQHAAGCELGPSDGIVGSIGGIGRDPMGNVPRHVAEAGNTQGMPGYSESTGTRPIERLVAAERDLFFTLFRLLEVRPAAVAGQPGYKSTTCTLTVQFRPRAGAQYEVAYYEDSGTCSARGSLLVQSGGEVLRIPEPSFRLSGTQCRGVR
jgi:hypothetical protein